ncbi:ribosome biogenesis regulatory protein-domain-containing protein [Trametes polyzona]|nr:ribosome biogenesis regulatory protein-domain-containing protein [Trametes polyzona]
MDVSDILAAHEAKKKSVTVEKEIPLEVDAGFLTVTDLNPVDQESYEADLEDYLMSTARDGVQTLIASLFSLPTTSSPDGPLAQLPAPTTQLPRAKPLPKPKPPTKWEQFAKAKGIQKKRKDKKVWDEEKQEWVDRWGWKGANKAKETQWLTEVPANADVDYDPSKVARDERKARIAKNERQHQQNLARAAQASGSAPPAASSSSQRKKEIDRTLAVTRTSTASMGKFDRKLEGEKKLKGMKRKFEPTEMPAESEKSHNLAILAKLDKEPVAKKSKKSSQESGGSDVLNVRKAIRSASKGKGSAALARKSGGKGKKTKGKR